MKNLIIILISIFLLTEISFAQNRRLEKIKEYYNAGEFTECIEQSKKYISRNSSESIGYYYLAFSNYHLYDQADENRKQSFVFQATGNLLKAVQKDRKLEELKPFEKEYHELQKILLEKGKTLFESDKKDKSRYYFDNLAKIYKDTTEEYLQIHYPERFNQDLSYVTAKSKALAQHEGPINQTDIKGWKQGIWIEKFDNGNIKHKINFVNDKPVGEFIKFYKNGNVKVEMTIDETGKRAAAILYHENGDKAAMGFYQNQEKDSLWQYFINDSLLILEESYNKGVKDGEERSYYIFGVLLEEINWKNGKKHGAWRRYYPTGRVDFETLYKNGQRHGIYNKYYENGKLNITGKYKNDLRHGIWKIHDAEKNEDIVLEYINGKPKNADKLEQKEQEWFDKMEKMKNTIPDPQNYLNNPREYMNKMD